MDEQVCFKSILVIKQGSTVSQCTLLWRFEVRVDIKERKIFKERHFKIDYPGESISNMFGDM